MIRTFAAMLLSIASGFSAYAQSTSAPVEFEVASIKSSPPPSGRGMSVGCDGGPGTTDPGMVSCENMSLTMLVTMAYKVSLNQLAAPDWMESQKFDIAARVPSGATKEQVARMWQGLLVGRFKLAARRESREVPMFDLLVAKGGPKFKEGSEDAPGKDGSPADQPVRHSPMKVDSDGFPELSRPGMIGVNGHIRLYQRKMTMEQLAKTLANQLGRPVTDDTGLKGEYDIRLSWVTEGLPPQSGAGGSSTVAEPAGGPTLMHAIQDELGLRLEAKRGPVEFLVVDHIEKLPSEN